MKKSIPERSATTQIIVDYLGKITDPTALITWITLAGLVNCNPNYVHSYLSSARKILVKEYQKNFITIHGQGIRLAAPNDAVAVGKLSTTKIHREAKRGLQRMTCTVYEEMTNENKIAFNAQASALGVMHAITDNRSINKIAKVCEEKKDKLLLQDTLKAFGVN